MKTICNKSNECKRSDCEHIVLHDCRAPVSFCGDGDEFEVKCIPEDNSPFYSIATMALPQGFGSKE